MKSTSPTKEHKPTGPSLAQLVNKWLKGCHKRWTMDFSTNTISIGRFSWESTIGDGKTVKILNDSFENRFWGIRVSAADPKFFTKLDRLMQFIERHDTRRARAISEFMETERDLLKEMLGK